MLLTPLSHRHSRIPFLLLCSDTELPSMLLVFSYRLQLLSMHGQTVLKLAETVPWRTSKPLCRLLLGNLAVQEREGGQPEDKSCRSRVG